MTGRGFTGHEHLDGFGLIHMNARLYDPILGRFLSPDPYVQLPDFTQAMNRYGYCMNRPLCYVDENGEFFWIVVGVAAGVAAVTNVVTHWNEITAVGGWNGFWKGAGYALAGGVAGGVGAAVGIGAAVGFGAAVGVTAAQLAAATTGILPGATVGAYSSATSGFLLNTSNSLLGGEKFGDALIKGLDGAVSGFISGSIMGGATGGAQALREGKNVWTGGNIKQGGGSNPFYDTEAVAKKSENYKLYEGIDTEGHVRYVGITKREPEIRFKEHLRSGTNRASLEYEVKIKNLSHINARIEEQKRINQYGLGKNGGVLFNLRNEIHPKYWIKFGIIK